MRYLLLLSARRACSSAVLAAVAAVLVIAALVSVGSAGAAEAPWRGQLTANLELSSNGPEGSGTESWNTTYTFTGEVDPASGKQIFAWTADHHKTVMNHCGELPANSTYTESGSGSGMGTARVVVEWYTDNDYRVYLEDVSPLQFTQTSSYSPCPGETPPTLVPQLVDAHPFEVSSSTAPAGSTTVSGSVSTPVPPGDNWERRTYTWNLTQDPEKSTIILVKQTDPAGAARAFHFDGALTGDLHDGESLSRVVDAGVYQSVEAAVPGWSVASISCDDAGSSGDPGRRLVEWDVSPGEVTTCTVTNRFGGSDLAMHKTVSPDAGAAGDDFTYELTATNLGPGKAAGVTVTDQIPAGFAIVAVTSSRGACATVEQTVSCYVAMLGVNDQQAVTIVVRALPNAAGTVTNTAVVSSDTLDPDLSNNADSALITLAQRCTAIESVYRAAVPGGGSDLMEYGLSASWCFDGTTAHLSGTPEQYGENLTPAFLASLSSVFDLKFRFTNEHPVVGVEPEADGSITLTAEGTFEVCGQLIPLDSVASKGELQAIKALEKVLAKAPAPARKAIVKALIGHMLTVFSRTGVLALLSEGEKTAIEFLLTHLLEEAAGDVSSLFGPICLPAWNPTITARLYPNGQARTLLTDPGSIFMHYKVTGP